MSAEKITALIAEARSAQGGRFYGPISDNPDALDLIARLADALEASVQAPAVDTGKAAKAIWDVLWPGTSGVMDDAELGSDRAQVARILFALTGPGILQDAAEVEARGLEKAADTLTAEEYDPDDQLWEPVSGTYMHPSAWLRARAQQVREGTA